MDGACDLREWQRYAIFLKLGDRLDIPPKNYCLASLAVADWCDLTMLCRVDDQPCIHVDRTDVVVVNCGRPGFKMARGTSVIQVQQSART